MRNPVETSRTCARPGCTTAFPATSRKRRYCSKACASLAHPERLRAMALKGNAVRREQQAWRLANALAERFGMMTPRELEIAKYMREKGYESGYNAGYRKLTGRSRVA